MKILKLFVLGCAALVFTACGNNNSDNYVSASSESYSPINAVDEKGNDTALYWKYKINEGKPVHTLNNGIYLRLDLNHAIVSIDKDHLERKFKLDGDVSGSIDQYGISLIGYYSLTGTDSLLLNVPGKVSIDQSLIHEKIILRAEGENAEMSFNGTIIYDNPYEWFLDNDNLETLNIGYYQNELSSGTYSGHIDFNMEPEWFESDFYSSEDWEIVDKMESITIQGKTYNDIVVIKRSTDIVNLRNEIDIERITITYWVAKGIGIIKAYNSLNILGKYVDIELVETNLFQP